MDTQVVVEWLNPFAHQFFVLKGLVGVLATVLLIVHMLKVYTGAMPLAQRLRYLALLYIGALITAGSYEQIHDEAVVNWRNMGGMLAAILLAAAAIASVVHDSKQTPAT